MANRKRLEDYPEEIINAVKNRDYSKGADAMMMSDEDYAATLYDQSLWGAADEAGRQAIHDRVEARRGGYNYSGGAAGNQYIKLNTNAAPSFSYESAPEYTSRYQQQIDDLTNTLLNRPEYSSRYQGQIDDLTSQLLNRAEFSYDYTQDPRWQAYRKEYAREGRRSSEDVMGQYAAMTGGMPSTAAMTAAQQAGNYYNAQMTDKIPELYQLAYDMYLNDLGQRRNDLNMLLGLDSTDYDRYWNGVAQQRNDLNTLLGLDSTDYDKYLNVLNQYNQNRAFDYGAEQDNLTRQAQARQEELERAIQAANFGDYSGLEALGITPNPEALLAMTLAGAGRTTPVGTGGGGGGGSAPKRSDDEGKSAATVRGGTVYSAPIGPTASGAPLDSTWLGGGANQPAGAQDVSDKAKSLANMARTIRGTDDPGRYQRRLQSFRDQVQAALSAGTISEEEAAYLLGLIGY